MNWLLEDTIAFYDELGFDTLPLIPGTKKPFPKAWQSRSSFRLWKNAPIDANIGIRAGGPAKVAIIDCDEQKTFEAISNYMTGLGYQPDGYPVVQTQSGTGRHIYSFFEGGLSGDWRLLSSQLGKGEFRFGMGSQVAAPPSVIQNGGEYKLIQGDFHILPRLSLKDVLPILGNQESSSKPKRTFSRRAMALLQGKNAEIFKSHSEADQSLIASLINTGHSFQSVLELFESNLTSGKYKEIQQEKSNKAALHYLRKSYDEARIWTKAHESKARRFSQELIEWAISEPWHGRTGPIDRDTFIAVAQIVYKAGRFEIAASCRDVALEAKIGRTAAANSLKRLVNIYKYLELIENSIGDCANIYCFNLENAKLGHFLTTGVLRECPSFANHDAFRKGKGKNGLGKSAGLVYQVLKNESLTLDELTERTGRDRRTVNYALERMSKLIDRKTGEILPLVTCDENGLWHSNEVDLDLVALIVGTAGASERQKRLHEKERRNHARLLQRKKSDEEQ